MRFELIDAILEASETRLVAIKHVSSAEEYLQDHFPTFPVLPGVFMLEAMAQAARELLVRRDPALGRCVLGEVRNLKYGAMVRPGESLRVEVELLSGAPDDSGGWAFKGVAIKQPAAGERPAAGGRFTLRPLRLASVRR